MSWTDEKVNKLKELWGKANTASQIAEIMEASAEMQLLVSTQIKSPAKIKTRAATSNQTFDKSISDKKMNQREEKQI